MLHRLLRGVSLSSNLTSLTINYASKSAGNRIIWYLPAKPFERSLANVSPGGSDPLPCTFTRPTKMEYSRAATAVVQSNVSLSLPSQLAPSPRFRLAWSDTPVMSGRCKHIWGERKHKVQCTCLHGEFDDPVHPDAECIECGHLHSEHEVASHATVDNTIQSTFSIAYTVIFKRI